MRSDFLAGKVQTLLDRLTPPASMQGKVDAQRDETMALIRAVNTHAPEVGYEDWWPRFEDALLGNRRSRVWPSLSAFHDAARAAGSSAKGTNAGIARDQAAMRDGWCERNGRVEVDDAAMTAIAMNTGQPVPEPALYGAIAAEIEERELVKPDALARLRKGAFMARRAVYGHAAAVEWETERKARHEAAVDIRRHRAAHEAGKPRQEWVA